MEWFPETRLSLIDRLRRPGDAPAWDGFSAVYRPVLVRLGRRRGLQEADAEDLAQQVLAAVAKAIPAWEPDPERGPFRAWLRTIAERLALNALTRLKPDRGRGGLDESDMLNQLPGRAASASEWRLEYRREVFRRAARVVEQEFAPDIWQCFSLTSVEERSVAEAAHELGKSPGAVYAGRARVLARLKEWVADWLEREEARDAP